MATLVERKTRFVMLIALPDGHAADVVADALAAKIIELPEQLRRSLTWDQGKEMAAHAQLQRRRPVSRSTSATRAAPGSAAATRTPTVCYASTSPNAPRSRTTPKPTSTTSPPNSTTGLDKPSDGSHHHKHSTKRCDDPLRPQQFWRADLLAAVLILALGSPSWRSGRRDRLFSARSPSALVPTDGCRWLTRARRPPTGCPIRVPLQLRRHRYVGWLPPTDGTDNASQ